jgi:signal transduction histidine kinase
LPNPLAAIHSAAEMLMDADLSPAHARRLARNILSASQRTQALLLDLLNLSRGERSAAQPSSLREVAEAACELLSATAESYGSTLIVEIHPEIELPLGTRPDGAGLRELDR